VTTSSLINWLIGPWPTAHRRAYIAALVLAVIAVTFGGWTHLVAAAAGALVAIGFVLRQRSLDEPVWTALLNDRESALRQQIAELEPDYYVPRHRGEPVAS
jgi:hypothetical protein